VLGYLLSFFYWRLHWCKCLANRFGLDHNKFLNQLCPYVKFMTLPEAKSNLKATGDVQGSDGDGNSKPRKFNPLEAWVLEAHLAMPFR
jgi:hypothetical protein